MTLVAVTAGGPTSELVGGALLGLAVLGLGLGRVWGAFLALATGAALVAAGGPLLPAGLVALAAFALLLPLLLRADALATVVLVLSLGGLGLGAGCLSVVPRAVTAKRPEPLIRVDGPPEPLPWREEVATRRVCTQSWRPAHSAPAAGRWPPRYVRKTVYDFDDLEVVPLPHGPELRFRSSARQPRSLAQVLEAALQREPVLKRCYRWARFRRPDLQGVVTVRMAIDHLGMTQDLLATSTPPAGELAACVADVLRGLQVAPYPFRRARVVLPIRFRPSGQGRASRPPARPPAGARGVPPAGCVDLPLLPPDRLQATHPALVVGDFDEVQEREDADRRALEAWIAGGRIGQRPARRPWIVHGITSCMCVSPPKDSVREELRRNMGAYRRCYREGLMRRPGLGGRVTTQVVFDELGTAVRSAVQTSTVEDRQLEQCLQQAVEQVRIVPLRRPTVLVVTVPLLLRPTVPAEQPLAGRVTGAALERAAKARLDAGDSRSAARLYRTLLRQLPRHRRGCGWQAGLATARLAMAPWSDRYVEREMVALARRLARPGCDEGARDLLLSWASEPHRQHRYLTKLSLLEFSVARYRRLLGALPAGSLAYQLRFLLAEALYRLQRHGEAGREYLQVAAAGGEHAREAAYSALHCARIALER